MRPLPECLARGGLFVHPLTGRIVDGLLREEEPPQGPKYKSAAAAMAAVRPVPWAAENAAQVKGKRRRIMRRGDA